MANITTYLENKLLEHSVKGNWTASLPTTTYAGLFIVTPTIAYLESATTGTEVARSHGYQRRQITWGPAASGGISNSSDIIWPSSETTGAWNINANASTGSPIGYIGVFDKDGSSSNGNLLWFGSLSAAVTISSAGDSFTISTGNLALTLS